MLDATSPGSVTAVVGRPGAGLSTTLGALCDAALTRGIPAVLACWERAPERWIGVVENDRVRIPAVMGWDTSTLARWAVEEGVAPGTLVAIDYLGLIPPDQSTSADLLSKVAHGNGWRLVLGIMAPRSLESLTGSPSTLEAAAAVWGALGGVLCHVDGVVALTGAGPLLLSA